jgi:hypothetical protein
MQNRVEHPVRPLHAPAGQLADALEDRVAVAVLVGEDRQDDRGRGSGDQILVDLDDLTRLLEVGELGSASYIAALYIAVLGMWKR